MTIYKKYCLPKEARIPILRKLLLKGATNEAIAEACGCSERTIRRDVGGLLRTCEAGL